MAQDGTQSNFPDDFWYLPDSSHNGIHDGIPMVDPSWQPGNGPTVSSASPLLTHDGPFPPLYPGNQCDNARGYSASLLSQSLPGHGGLGNLGAGIASHSSGFSFDNATDDLTLPSHASFSFAYADDATATAAALPIPQLPYYDDPATSFQAGFHSHQGLNSHCPPNSDMAHTASLNQDRTWSYPTNLGDISVTYDPSSGRRKKDKPRATRPPEEPRPRKQGRQERGRTRADWKPVWGDHVRHLYIEENHTAQEVAFEMEVLHGVRDAFKPCQLSKHPGFRKNATDRTQDGRQALATKRRRPAASLPKSGAKDTSPVFQLRSYLQLKSHLPINIVPSAAGEQCHHQHKMLHTIHALVQGIFDTKKKDVVQPVGAEYRSAWQLLYDKCLGFAAVCGGGTGGRANFLYNQILEQLRKLPELRDYMFLIYIWKICLSMSAMRFPGRTDTNRFIFLQMFLMRLRSAFTDVAGGQQQPHSEVVLLECLFRVLSSSPQHFKTTLGIGCWKAMNMIGSMIGHEHTLILAMGVYCIKHWKNNFEVNVERLEPQYKLLLDQQEDAQRPSEDQAAVLYGYASTLLQKQDRSRGEKILDSTAEYAARLLALTAEPCRTAARARSLRYDVTTRAFAFASELVANHRLETQVSRETRDFSTRGHTFSTPMDQAIEVLRNGDLECRVRAAELSKRLAIWLKSYCPGDKVSSACKRPNGRVRGPMGKQEKQRTREILSAIGQMPVPVHAVRQPSGEKAANQNNRWRNKQRRVRKAVLQDLVEVGQADGVVAVSQGPERSLRGKKEREPAHLQPPAANPSPCDAKSRTCLHCCEMFPSRNDLFRHLGSGCLERHPWAMV
ncbi:hypothetical protein B0H67DRAFT_553066 [Lasiosphaeris hirsuta]|uniref:Uncharacterized protein n=1 Tax=Lasiosphaeris hirsuta TaxID=260670 RepID=A0AA40E1Q1_9PEZI|nr:hypothetical protein B0H67DRAFT_553066 [Lasiosphaeris hirsuta]